MMTHFFELYGRRNRIFLPGLLERILFLSLAINDLQEALRKDVERSLLKMAMARIVSRIFCIAEHFHNLPLINALAMKYPFGRCAYCMQFPCACRESRPDATLVVIVEEMQMTWSLRNWCHHLNAVYGAKNENTPNARENLLNRLSREVSELLSILMDLPNNTETIDEIEFEFALELADTLAWTIAIANLLGVDLEKAVIERFVRTNCWNCHQKPCICKHFNVKLVKWSHVFLP